MGHEAFSKFRFGLHSKKFGNRCCSWCMCQSQTPYLVVPPWYVVGTARAPKVCALTHIKLAFSRFVWMTVNAGVCPWYSRKPAKIIVSHICSELAGSLTNRIISSNGFAIQTCLQSSFKENRVEVLYCRYTLMRRRQRQTLTTLIVLSFTARRTLLKHVAVR